MGKLDDYKKAFDAFNSMNVLIIGDVMIDAYFNGVVDRISPEAPVPVVHVKSREKRLGGAANVARNIRALGANPILCSVIGSDDSAGQLLNLMSAANMNCDGILKSSNRVTTVKTRIISGSQHMIRIDEEAIIPLSQEEEQDFFTVILNLFQTLSIDAVIFEDYDKGSISSTLIQKVVAEAQQRNIPISVDPKKDRFLDYKGVTLFKPNFKELSEGLKLELTKEKGSIQKADQILRQHLNNELSLITLSEKGVYVSDQSDQTIIPAHIRNIADVSGAGDTVIAVATLCLAAQLSKEDVAQISNLAGGLVCEKVGVVSIDKANLLSETLHLLQ